ncbi:MAG TPA: OsmC family protein [Candidatus Limnocylindrales bacterium]|nr:OsmC family protein [Candidatus Limnocylindrales bacterium]
MTSVVMETAAKFRADPEAARTAPAVTATLADGRARLSAGAFSWEADLPPSLGGTNAAPSPTAYLLGALAGCGVTFLNDTLAPEFGVAIHGITAIARCRADLGGLVGLEGVAPDLTDLEIEIEVDTPDPESKTGPMLEAWQRRCPIFLVLRNPNAVALRLTAGPM